MITREQAELLVMTTIDANGFDLLDKVKCYYAKGYRCGGAKFQASSKVGVAYVVEIMFWCGVEGVVYCDSIRFEAVSSTVIDDIIDCKSGAVRV